MQKYYFKLQQEVLYLVCNNNYYPLRVRYKLNSFYEENRTTFIYNLDEYDIAIVITDAVDLNKSGVDNLVSAMEKNNCRKIKVFRWCK